MDTVTAAAGQHLAVECQDYTSNSATYFELGTIAAVLIAPASGTSAISHAVRSARHVPARRLMRGPRR